MKNSIPNKISNFKRYQAKKTTMKYGYYYQAIFDLPFAKENKRMVRVWLPEDYDFHDRTKKYPVIYMSDGQNLVDRYLSAYGDWELDKSVHSLYKEHINGVIAVGIDCPKDPEERVKELCPPFMPTQNIVKHAKHDLTTYGDKYIDFIINEIKPIIDRLFHTKKDKENTAIGGSSMGGLMAFYAYVYRSDVFGFSLSFSPALFFYTRTGWSKILSNYKISPELNGKLFFYVGGKEFESEFTKPTIEMYYQFRNMKFNNDQLALIVDSREIHHEKAWVKYLPDALRFWLLKKLINT